MRMKSCYAARFCRGFIASRDSREHWVLRLDGKDEVEFVTLTTFDSMEAVTQEPAREMGSQDAPDYGISG